MGTSSIVSMLTGVATLIVTTVSLGPGLHEGSARADAAVPSCRGRPATIVGTDRNDRIKGGPGPDVIAGLGGDDVIRGEQGNDVLCGGYGDDELVGVAGNDRLSGGPGNDGLFGAQRERHPGGGKGGRPHDLGRRGRGDRCSHRGSRHGRVAQRGSRERPPSGRAWRRRVGRQHRKRSPVRERRPGHDRRWNEHRSRGHPTPTETSSTVERGATRVSRLSRCAGVSRVPVNDSASRVVTASSRRSWGRPVGTRSRGHPVAM